MAKVILKMQNLEEINFDDCILKRKGVIATLRALTGSHPKLQVLRLNGNEASKSCISYLKAALIGKTHIQTVSLSCNQLGDSGIQLLHEVMAECGVDDKLEEVIEDEGSAAEGEDEEGGSGSDPEDRAWEHRLPERPECDQAESGSGTQISQCSATKTQAQVPPTTIAALNFEALSSLEPRAAGRAVMNMIKEELDNADVVVAAVLYLGGRLTNRNQHTSQMLICNCCCEIMRAYVQNSNELTDTALNNALGAELGLIKAETPYPQVDNYFGVFTVLAFLGANKTLPPSTRIVLRFMLEQDARRQPPRIPTHISSYMTLMDALKS
jgi:hypothetical protein